MWNRLFYFLELLLLSKVKGVGKIILFPIPPVHQFPSLPKIIRFFLGWHRRILTKELRSLEKKIPELEFENIEESYPPEYFSKDGIHPSDLGYKLLAVEISKKRVSEKSRHPFFIVDFL
jgi:lysophospholipase L1-like esterase